MPRKQRFKPSRKPKPVDNPPDAQPIGAVIRRSGDERTEIRDKGSPGAIEAAGPARARVDSSAVVDQIGSHVSG